MTGLLTQDELGVIRQNASTPQGRLWVQGLIEPHAHRMMRADLAWADQPSGSEADWTCPVHNMPMTPDDGRPGTLVCPIDGQAFDGPARQSAIRFFRHETLALGARSLALLAHLRDEPALAKQACQVLDAYARSYPRMPVIGSADFWRAGRATPFFLLEATWCLALLNAAQLLRQTGHAEPGRWLAWRDSIFLPCAESFMHRVPLIHNIRCWLNALTGCIGIAFDDDALTRHAIDAEFGLRDQLARGLLPDGTWCETSTLYQFYCLQAMLIHTQAMKRAGQAEEWIDRRIARMTRAALRYLLPDTTMIPINDTADATHVSPWLCATLRVASDDADVHAAVARRLAMLRDELTAGNEPSLSLCRHGGRAVVDLLLPARACRAPAAASSRGLKPDWKTNVPTDAVLEEDSPHRLHALKITDGQGSVAFLERGGKAASHMHYERLGLLLWLQGKPVLIDRGTIGYHLGLYNFYRYTPAHNTMSLWNWHHLHESVSQVIESTPTRLAARVMIHQGIFLTRTCELSDGQLIDQLDWQASIKLPAGAMVDFYLHPAGRPMFEMTDADAGDFDRPYFGFTGMGAPRRVRCAAGDRITYDNPGHQVHLDFLEMPADTQAWCVTTPGRGSQPSQPIEALVLRTAFAQQLRYVCRYSIQ